MRGIHASSTVGSVNRFGSVSVGTLVAPAQGTPIYRRTGNIREIKLMLGHAKLQSVVRYFGHQG